MRPRLIEARMSRPMSCHPLNLNRHDAGEFVFLADHCCFSLFVGIDVFLNVDKFRGQGRKKKKPKNQLLFIHTTLCGLYLFGPFSISVILLFSGQLIGRKPATIRLTRNTIYVSEYAPKKKCRDVICSRFWYIRVCHSRLNMHREDKGIP